MFDFLSQYLIIAELNVYRFSLDSSRLIYNYLSNRKQRTRTNEYIALGKKLYSMCDKVQFSGLFRLISLYVTFVNIYMHSALVRGNTGRNTKAAFESLVLASNDLMEWFSKNNMNANPRKFHLLDSSKTESKICIKMIM